MRKKTSHDSQEVLFITFHDESNRSNRLRRIRKFLRKSFDPKIGYNEGRGVRGVLDTGSEYSAEFDESVDKHLRHQGIELRLFQGNELHLKHTLL